MSSDDILFFNDVQEAKELFLNIFFKINERMHVYKCSQEK